MSSPIHALVEQVLIGCTPGTLISTPQPQAVVTFAGFEGDLHAGLTRRADGRTPYYPRGLEIRNDRQVSLVSLEELAQVAQALNLPEVRPEWLGANLLLSGIPHFSLLPPNTRLVFAGQAVLVVQSQNQPCTAPGQVLADQFNRPELKSAFVKAALQRRGLVACVEKPGLIAPGDVLEAHLPAQQPPYPYP